MSSFSPVALVVVAAISIVAAVVVLMMMRRMRPVIIDAKGPTSDSARRALAARRAGPSLAKLEDAAARWLIVVDFECTCIRNTVFYRRAPWVHEIIEFPAVLIDLHAESTRDGQCDVFAQPHFHRFVRPTESPRLTEFCTELTGITQSTVDEAPTLDVVLKEFFDWLDEHGLDASSDQGDAAFAIATDGPWDMRKFLLAECARKKLAVKPRLHSWVDVSLHLKKFYNLYRCTLENKLLRLGMRFEGRPHSGLDDARNIARLALRLFHDGCPLALNDGWGGARITQASRSHLEKKQARRRQAKGPTGANSRPIEVDW